MFRYYFQRILCDVCALAIAASIVLMVFCTTFLVLFQNQSFINRCFTAEKSSIIAMTDEALAQAAEELGLESDAMKGAVDDSNLSAIISTLTDAVSANKTADFSDNSELYNSIAHRLSAYDKKVLSSAEINRCASYGVDCVNEVLGTDAASRSPLIAAIHSRALLYVIIGGVVIIGISIGVIEFFNNGRHRRYNYYGMGMNTAGAVLLLVPLYIRLTNRLGNQQFASFELYDLAIKSVLSYILKAAILVGIVLLLAGTVMLFVNYNYFRKRNNEIKQRRERSLNEQELYLEEDMPAVNVNQRNENGEFEKEIMRIEFDE